MCAENVTKMTLLTCFKGKGAQQRALQSTIKKFLAALADILQTTLAAMGTACSTGVAPMQKNPIVPGSNKMLGDVLDKCLFYSVGCSCALGHESEAVTDTEDMGIDGKCSLVEGNSLHDVGGLAAHTRQRRKLLKC